MSSQPKIPLLTEEHAPDVRTLFRKAQMHGAKYVEFSREFPRNSPAVETAPMAPPPVAQAVVAPTPIARMRPAADAEAVVAQKPVVPASLSWAGITDKANSGTHWTGVHRLFEQRNAALAEVRPACYARVAICSLAGGVGKSTLCAGLARALAMRSEQVSILDCTPFGDTPHNFGLTPQSAGTMQMLPSVAGSGAPIALFSALLGGEPATRGEGIPAALESRSTVVLMDLPGDVTAWAQQLLASATHILVPVVPDVQSSAGIFRLEAMLSSLAEAGTPVKAPTYILNRYQPARQLHQDIHECLRAMLGDRLFATPMREDHLVSDAAAMGMTILDHAPASAAAIDIQALAKFIQQGAPQPSNGQRRSEFA